MGKLHLATALLSALAFTPASAQAFEKIVNRDAFMSTVLGKELKRFGIVVRVTEDGQITGTGFGRPVRGAWNWQDGFFCRSLYWGQRDLGPNCQEVRVNGEMIRFTSDLGNGIYADLKME